MKKTINFSNPKKYISLLITVYVFLIFPFLNAITVYGQEEIDVVAPFIKINKFNIGAYEAGDEITVSAIIHDNSFIDEVILSYWPKGNREKKKDIVMKFVGRDEYIAAINAVFPGVEYNITAIDGSSNTATYSNTINVRGQKGPDLISPTIKVEKINKEEFEQGDKIIISAIIADDSGFIENAILTYWPKGNREKKKDIVMKSIGKDEYISAIIAEPPEIEYLISASDGVQISMTAENKIIVRKKPVVLRAAINKTTDIEVEKSQIENKEDLKKDLKTKEELERKNKWYKKWWVWALVTGVITASATGAATCGFSGCTPPPPPPSSAGPASGEVLVDW